MLYQDQVDDCRCSIRVLITSRRADSDSISMLEWGEIRTMALDNGDANTKMIFRKGDLAITSERIFLLSSVDPRLNDEGIPLHTITDVKKELWPIDRYVVLLVAATILLFLDGFTLIALGCLALLSLFLFFGKYGVLSFRDGATNHMHHLPVRLIHTNEAASLLDDAVSNAVRQKTEASPLARYRQAVEIWERGTDNDRDKALAMMHKLISENVDIPDPYLFLYQVAGNADPVGQSWLLTKMAARLREIEPHNEAHLQRHFDAMAARAKHFWDEGNENAAFLNYFKILEEFSETGGVLSQNSATSIRVAFVGCRMFAKKALDKGDDEWSIKLLDWCDNANIDINADFDVNDARAPA